MFRILLITLTLYMSGCASTPISLDRQSLEARKIQRIYISAHRGTLRAEESVTGQTAGVGAGLLGVLIGGAVDSGVNRKRNKHLEPVIAALQGYNPNKYLAAAIMNEAKGPVFADNLQVEFGSEDPVTSEPHIIADYVMAADFSRVSITLFSQLIGGGNEGKDFSNSFTSSQYLTYGKTAAENKQYWILNPDKLADKIQAATSRTVQMLVADLNGTADRHTPRAQGDYPPHNLVGVATSNASASEQAELTSAGELEDESSDTVSASTQYPGWVTELGSGDTMRIRAAAKAIAERKIYADAGLIQASIATLAQYLEQGVDKKDAFLIDGLAWCALNLGNAHAVEAKPILAEVIASDLPRKLRSHTIHALNQINAAGAPTE